MNERISKVISYSKLSPSEFADKVDVQRSSISHITSGRNKPSLDFLIKVKEAFPELSWDWLIHGTGEMLIQKEPVETSKKPDPTSLPDLFSIINKDDFGYPTESEDKIEPDFPIPSESRIPIPRKVQTILSDSQPIEKTEPIEKKKLNSETNLISEEKNIEPKQSPENKIVRIVIFYENGKFESFEP